MPHDSLTEIIFLIAQCEVNFLPGKLCLSTVDKPYKLYALLIILLRQ
ncbi:hypothetical protein HMPREF0484_0814 [Klebsiella pneumoniae subsp. rhinoscleromatis ATCC 13884]|nr:hypothetical protein HMPREF0484_0814 [Klebsiella pneumoniae subsp. rhinoscleromatis ATCC 13884]